MFWLITAVYVLSIPVLILSYRRRIREYTREIDRLNRSRTAAYERGRRLGNAEARIEMQILEMRNSWKGNVINE